MKNIYCCLILMCLILTPAFADLNHQEPSPYGFGGLLYDMGLVKGDGTTLNPQASITREEILTLVNRAFPLNNTPLEPAPFKDVPHDHWAAPFINQAYQVGRIQGMSPTKFGLGQAVTYQEALAMILRAMGKATSYDMVMPVAHNQLGLISLRAASSKDLTRDHVFELIAKAVFYSNDQTYPYLAGALHQDTDPEVFINQYQGHVTTGNDIDHATSIKLGDTRVFIQGLDQVGDNQEAYMSLIKQVSNQDLKPFNCRDLVLGPLQVSPPMWQSSNQTTTVLYPGLEQNLFLLHKMATNASSLVPLSVQAAYHATSAQGTTYVVMQVNQASSFEQSDGLPQTLILKNGHTGQGYEGLLTSSHGLRFVKQVQAQVSTKTLSSIDYNKDKTLDYFAYGTKHPDYDALKIIKSVNLGLDQAFYSQILTPTLKQSQSLVVLVNKYNKLPQEYKPNQRLVLPNAISSQQGLSLQEEAARAFIDMATQAKSQNIVLKAVSAYRDYDRQALIYQNYTAKHGQAKADTFSARPGHSEHQTGLAVDINTLNESFEGSKAFEWLQENGHLYGFILRYPKAQSHYTGYIYEPWHWRYVGRDTAQVLVDMGWLLEDYHYMQNSMTQTKSEDD